MSYRLLRARDVAERWGVGHRQVLALARRGDLPRVKLGKYVRFRPEDVEAFERRASESELPHSEKRPGAAATARGMAPGGKS